MTSTASPAHLELRSSLALFFMPNLGPVRVKALLEAFGTAERVLAANLTELREIGRASCRERVLMPV